MRLMMAYMRAKVQVRGPNEFTNQMSLRSHLCKGDLYWVLDKLYSFPYRVLERQ